MTIRRPSRLQPVEQIYWNGDRSVFQIICKCAPDPNVVLSRGRPLFAIDRQRNRDWLTRFVGLNNHVTVPSKVGR